MVAQSGSQGTCASRPLPWLCPPSHHTPSAIHRQIRREPWGGSQHVLQHKQQAEVALPHHTGHREMVGQRQLAHHRPEAGNAAPTPTWTDGGGGRGTWLSRLCPWHDHGTSTGRDLGVQCSQPGRRCWVGPHGRWSQVPMRTRSGCTGSAVLPGPRGIVASKLGFGTGEKGGHRENNVTPLTGEEQ